MPRPAIAVRISDWFASWLSAAMRRTMRANAVLRRRLAAVNDRQRVSDANHQRDAETIQDLREQVRGLESTVAILDEETELAAKRWAREIERQKAEAAIFVSRRVAGQRAIDQEE